MLVSQPQDPFLNYAIAMEYRAAADKENAWEYFNRILETQPDYLPVYYQAASLAMEQHEFKKAIALYQKGIEVAGSQKEFKTLGELSTALDIALDEAQETD
jgi:tetratricopeptide (TPR) repeat protein